ncbi:carbohydrate sulfotransferase 11-like [Acanthaster planci]|uniref:Carbohydrate sulfotransferase n=1 Tax=Acanthaster planci TaxID=133434 RepID=A0A8B7XJ32_ACAPL|nr:carbohydrate sulfotransferase 11-like [Acanthaster planci]XP_022080219.1 carbohydrate sulfotransferase 11-like [Acanthaster planci]XP_022080309.1 carbohydrate sulfotransferase 11-like [Acanthaster planci]
MNVPGPPISKQLCCLAYCILCLIVVFIVTLFETTATDRPKPIGFLGQHPKLDVRRLSGQLRNVDLTQSTWQQNGSRTPGKSSENEERSEEVELEGFMELQAAIQQERRKHLTWGCSRHPELSRSGISRMTLQQIYVNDEYKILYCFVPKVACSNWKRVLMVLGGVRNRTEDITLKETNHPKGLRKLSHFNPAEQTHRLHTYTKFMYTRHPFRRILSTYLDKFAGRVLPFWEPLAKHIIMKYRRNAKVQKLLKSGRNITWHEWIAYLTDPRERAGFDSHWMEIHKICSPCKVRYDYLGKLETANDDARYILTSLGLQDKISFPTGDRHQTNSSQVYSAFLRRTVNASLQTLWRMYNLDFELFGYDKPDFL